MKSYYVYIMANDHGNVLYIGVTNNLERRVYEHKNGLYEGFSKKYKTIKLVYFEETNSIEGAITREKEIKKWRREKKDALIQSQNPNCLDLSNDWHEIFHPLKKGSK